MVYVIQAVGLNTGHSWRVIVTRMHTAHLCCNTTVNSESSKLSKNATKAHDYARLRLEIV